MYLITKQFTNGTLKDLIITENTNVKMEVGTTYSSAGSDYKVIQLEEIK